MAMSPTDKPLIAVDLDEVLVSRSAAQPFAPATRWSGPPEAPEVGAPPPPRERCTRRVCLQHGLVLLRALAQGWPFAGDSGPRLHARWPMRSLWLLAPVQSALPLIPQGWFVRALNKFHNARFGTSYREADYFSYHFSDVWGCTDAVVSGAQDAQAVWLLARARAVGLHGLSGLPSRSP